MEQSMVHLAESAAWVFFFVFLFAVIGVIATVRWIIAMVTRGELAVEAEAHKVGDAVTHHGDHQH
ncbi:MAG: hypothetical protein M3R30_07215 [Candidatus Eremiobacteraeota bacterium]|nr:hypothetical protein [Candidatus Eremiobacteraeota bacterium]